MSETKRKDEIEGGKHDRFEKYEEIKAAVK